MAPEAPISLQHPVLHIRPEAVAAGPLNAHDSLSMDARLATAGLAADTCGDIYRGLARLCLDKSDATRIVVVCLDELGPAEYEFFTVVSRVRRNASVYVYCRHESAPQTARAIERGAVGEATEDVLRMLAAAIRASKAANQPLDRSAQARTPKVREMPADADAQNIRPTFDDTDSAPGAAVRGVGRSPGAVEEPTTADPAVADGTRDGADSAERARVPWLRYADKPVRTAPMRPGPLPARGAPSAPSYRPEDWAGAGESTSGPTSLEPLLTDEELEALLSDDIAAIAPEEPCPPLEDDEQDPVARGQS